MAQAVLTGKLGLGQAQDVSLCALLFWQAGTPLTERMADARQGAL